MTTTCICTGCGQTFKCQPCGDSRDFDMHDCPNVLAPLKGESFEDYKARCDAARN